MAHRVTAKELEAIVARIRQFTSHDYSLGYAYGGVRLESDNGSRDVSPRLSKGEMYTWLHAFFDGIQVGMRLPKANPGRGTAKRSRSHRARAPRTRGTRRNPSEKVAWQSVARVARGLQGSTSPLIKRDGNDLAGLAEMMLAQLAKGIHENPALAVLGNPGSGVAGTIAKRVYEIRYQHAQDGKNYKHPFGPGVRCTLLTDGRAVIWHPSKPVWQDL